MAEEESRKREMTDDHKSGNDDGETVGKRKRTESEKERGDEVTV